MKTPINNEKKGKHGKIFMQWQFRETPTYKRGLLWYFLSGIILVLLLGYAISSRNFLFALILILFSALFFIFNRNPSVIEAEIAQDGIKVGRKFYPYSEIEKFWIIYEPPHIKSLYIHVKHAFLPVIFLPLEDQNPIEVRRVLSRSIEEDTEQKEEPPFDTFSRIFKL